ncbi:unnamed protein product [Chrysodeixis includens]|uniref:Uncharacterized protein n=1 Tax=Chrysodeixis includens TaxID=689277 RepID=A0A9N8L0Q0_CHRIL|nr:unnamed protein product [Chrysodeixis includens]
MTPASYAGHIIVHKRVLTQGHSLFLDSHSPMGRQSDTTGERSGAGPTFLRVFRNTEAVIFISKTHTTFEKSVRAVEIELETFDLTVLRSYHKASFKHNLRLMFF